MTPLTNANRPRRAPCSLVPDLSGPSSVLRQQAAAVGLSAEALLRHLVSAALVRGGGEPLPPLPEVAAAAEEAAAEAAAAEAGAGEAAWSPWAALSSLEEGKVQEMLASRAAALQQFQAAGGEGPPPLLHGSLSVAAQEFSTWCSAEELEQRQQQQQQAAAAAEAAAAEGGAGGGAFEFVDATADPGLDPVYQQQQQEAASWQQWQQEAAGGLPPSYDEIAAGAAGTGYLSEVAAHMALEDPADAQVAAEAGAPGGPNPEHMHPTKQRVWVLLGGEGPDRQQSLAAGLHVYTRCGWGWRPACRCRRARRLHACFASCPCIPPGARSSHTLCLFYTPSVLRSLPAASASPLHHHCSSLPARSLRQHPEYLVEGYLLEHNFAGSRWGRSRACGAGRRPAAGCYARCLALLVLVALWWDAGRWRPGLPRFLPLARRLSARGGQRACTRTCTAAPHISGRAPAPARGWVTRSPVGTADPSRALRPDRPSPMGTRDA